MPVKAEQALERAAAKKGYKKGSKRWRAYVYGALRKLGWKPARETTSKPSKKSRRRKK